MTSDSFTRTMIDAMEGLSGPQPGYRRVHARGLILAGSFTPSGEAARFTTAPHLQRDPVSTITRFSHTSGDPRAVDGTPTVRGMAVKFFTPTRAESDIVTVNVPAFVASTPPDFLELVNRLTGLPVQGPERREAIGAFVAAHPESVQAFKFAGQVAIPASYATSRYWATHAFVWIDAAGRRRFVRYRWEPAAGVRTADLDAVPGWPATHLTDELVERLHREPVRFTLRVQFAEPGDPVTDSTQIWPDDREEITAGTLEIAAPAQDQAYWSATTFDPTLVGDGIGLSDDPVLLVRGLLYDESRSRRLREARALESPRGEAR
jgi:catalase